MPDVLVIGGGNAALCAAIAAREAGASVCLLESAPPEWRGGNSMHTRNIRCMHDTPQDVLTDAYPEQEFWEDLLKVTAGRTDELLARFVIRESSTVRTWMRRHGVRFQPSLSGTLHLSRTNAFFLGGGKALVNAYYRSAQSLGVDIRYGAEVVRLELDGSRFVAAHLADGTRLAARACVVASGGFESNREWLREAWGMNERGEWPAEAFLIRRRTWWPSTRVRPCTTAASARAWTACRWASSSTARGCASTTRARISGPSATPSGAGSWRASPARWDTP
jgi:tricarballylate dehydrogenase